MRKHTSTSALRALETESARVADQIIDVLEEYGVVRAFGIPGGTISPLFDALIDSGIDVVTCQHETMAVYLAAGHARATGTPGVVLVTSGPGVLNAITGVAAAFCDEVPLLVLGGEVHSHNGGRGALQDGGPGGLDVAAMMRPITKLVDTLQQPRRVSALVHQALDAAMSQPRGPTFLRVPVDVASAALPSVQVVRAKLESARPDPEVCQHIARALNGAARPAIFAGIGARTGGVGPALLEIAEWRKVPIITDIEARGIIPESHPMCLGVFGVGGAGLADGYLAEGVDVLLTVGARLDDTTTNGWQEVLRPDGLVIQLDHDAHRLCRGYRADVAMACDLLEALAHTLAAARVPDFEGLLARDTAVAEARRQHRIPQVAPLSRAPHDPNAVIRALRAAFPSDTAWTSDIGNHLLFASTNLQIESPEHFHVSVGLGGMGSGIGMALGLGMSGRSSVVGVCGDGGLLMVGNELATCARRGINVVLAVLDDGQLGMVEHGNRSVFGRSDFCAAGGTDLTAWALSLGANAVRVEEAADLTRAMALVGQGPLLLHFPIDPSVAAINPRAQNFKGAR